MTNPPLRDRLSAIGTLLIEMGVILLLFFFPFTFFASFLDGMNMLFDHYAFGESWAWARAHFVGRLLLWFLIVISVFLGGGMIWTFLRDEYQQILKIRMRK